MEGHQETPTAKSQLNHSFIHPASSIAQYPLPWITFATRHFSQGWDGVWWWLSSIWKSLHLNQLENSEGNLNEKKNNVHSSTQPHNEHATQESQRWLNTSGHLFNLLLQHSDYPRESHSLVLDFFQYTIVPYLGRCTTNQDPQQWNSFMTDDGCPIEFSWDWATSSQRPQIRFSIEPVGLYSGTEINSRNVFAPKTFLEKVLRVIPAVDFEWYDHFAKLFQITDDGLEHSNRIFYAFDIQENGRMVPKAYFFPGVKAAITQNSTWDTVVDAITTAPSCKPEKLHALTILGDFLATEKQLVIEMLGTDLLPPNDSRLKIYFRSPATDFASVIRIMTLNHQLRDERYLKGIHKLRELWSLLFNHQDEGQLKKVAHRTAGVLYYADFRLGDAMPKVKIYIPVRHYAVSDTEVLRGLTAFLEANGQGLYVERYRNVLDEVFSPAAMEMNTGIHTYIGVSINSDGSLKLISYLNPQVAKMK